MKKLIIVLVLLSTLFTQCVPSLHPLYTESDLITDDRIIGEWSEGGGTDTWNFVRRSAAHPKSYMLIMSQEDGQHFHYDARLVKIGQETYMDFYPKRVSKGKVNNYFPEEFNKSAWLKVHLFAKVSVEEDKLNIQFFDDEWIEKMIKERKIRIKHEKINEGVLLTASTSELQQFIQKYANEEKAFLEVSKLERK